jgi:RHS repeat-associated protein
VYQYDDLGNLLKEISPDRGTVSYAYDAAGNLTQQTDARGIVSTYTYDALNRLLSINYGSSVENVTYAYDSNTNCTFGLGRLCAVVDESGGTAYGYDAFGNALVHTHTELGITYNTFYSYDAGNRITSITYPDGRVVNTPRDVLGRITAVTSSVNGSAVTLAGNRSFRPDGLLLGQSFGNGLNELRQYDTQGRLTYQSLASADTRLYGYDANGNLTSEQSLPQVGAYAYDALNRLTQDAITSTPASTLTLTYDGNGNRLSENTGSYAYLATSNRLTTTPAGSISLDAAGNTVGDGARSFVYNQAGQLSQVTGVASYSYNHLRQRTRKVLGSTATVYHYDLNGRLIAETREDGSLIRDYVWADDQPVAQISLALRGGQPLPPRLPAARLPLPAIEEELVYLHTDHLNTPRLATSPTGAVVWRWEGKAFGDTAPTGSRTVNLRFAGQYFDSETGLHYNWNRYYDPRIGRYLSHDPSGLYYPEGLNPYAYAANNPLYWIDPTGLGNIHVLPSIIPTGNPIYPNWMIPTNDWGFPTGAYPGSTKPDPQQPNCKNKDCPEILPGTYPYKVTNFPITPRPNRPQIPAPRIGDDGTVPTRNPNPNQGGQSKATGVYLHPGGRTRTGSEGCLTLDPKYWDDFMKEISSSGNVKVW